MQTAISYARKSYYKGEMSDEEIVSYQHYAIREYCSNRNIELVNEFSDVNYSGTNLDRPSLQEILDYVITNQNIDCVIFYSVDRLGRSNSGNIDVVQELFKYVSSIAFVTDDMTLGKNNPHMVKMLFALLSSNAANFSESHSNNLRKNNDHKLHQLKTFLGSFPPIGFTRRQEDGRLVPATYKTTNDIKEIEGLEILELTVYSTLMGASYRSTGRAIAKHYSLSRKNRSWNDHSKVREVLKNPVYIGALKGERGGSPYFIENANVEKILSPTIYYFINQLHLRKGRGRHSTVLNRLPCFNICVGCYQPLQKEGKNLVCKGCDNKVAENIILEKVNYHLKQRIEPDCAASDLISDLLTRYNRKIEEMKGQVHNYEVLLSKFEHSLQTRVVQKNICEIREILSHNREELYLLQEMRRELQVNYNCYDSSSNKYYNNLINLPYLILIKFTPEEQKHKVQLLFYKEVFM